MNTFTSVEAVEVFHLVFLSFLGRKADKRAYALKGGCNLRFFFHSPRYSEDMDLDVAGIPVFKLREIVNALLGSAPFAQALSVHRVRIDHITEHKQSETTQRWKLGLSIPGEEQPIPTKIEFSRRGLQEDSVFERIHPEILDRYRLTPFLCSHYPAGIACRQKIEALATRAVPQARDVFDLWLLGSAERLCQARAEIDPGIRETAATNLASLSFDHFRGQVLPYLNPDDQRAYASADVWERMQLELMERLS